MGPALHQDAFHAHLNPAGPEHNCIHDQLRRAAPVLTTPQSYGHVSYMQQRARRLMPLGSSSYRSPYPPASELDGSELRPIRIHVDYSRLSDDPGFSCFSTSDSYQDEDYKTKRCGWGDLITHEKRELLSKKLLPGAVDFFRRLLSVRRVEGALRVGISQCGYNGGVQVPAAVREHGVADADFVIFLTMRPIASHDTVAFSGHCEQDQWGRPTVAQFNWAPAQLQEASRAPSPSRHPLTHSLTYLLVLPYRGRRTPTSWWTTSRGSRCTS